MSYILVVEDSADLNELFCRRLQKGGYQTRPAYTLRQAISEVQREAPRVIVLDLELPDGSGAEVLPLLKGGQFADTKVIVVSANAYSSGDGLEGYHIDHIFVKPLSPKHLVMLVGSLIK